MPTIYSISHPSQPNVIYIGKTRSSLKYRLSGHINSNNDTLIRKWIDDLMNKNAQKPAIEPIEICDDDFAAEAELFWIEQFRAWGFILLNKHGVYKSSYRVSKNGKRYKYYFKKIKTKRICQYGLSGNLIGIHLDTKDASRLSGVSKYSISKQLNGKVKYPRKYIFKYAA